jgi:hypothetical protein
VRPRLIAIVVPLCFVASCGAFLLPAARVTDPLTHKPFNRAWPFPILIVKGNEARVLHEDHYQPPILGEGETFLVPAGKADAFERALNDARPPGRDSAWVLRVDQTAADRQRIELYLMGDGYSGSVYEATRLSVTPLYSKLTGPAFSFVFAGVALVMNLVLWGTVGGMVAVVRRWRRASPRGGL